MCPVYARGHDNPGVAAVIAALEEWLLALEDGSASLRLPDLSCDNARWTEERLDKLVKEIDREIDAEVSRAPGQYVGAKAGPGFVRLAAPQRLALAQQLSALIQEHRASLSAFGIDAGAVSAAASSTEGIAW